MHLSDRKSILSEYFDRWKMYAETGREFTAQWKQFVTDARQVAQSADTVTQILAS